MEILNPVEYTLKQAANPYSEAKNACFEDCPGTSGSSNRRENEDEEETEQEEEDSLRITTRARLTYELYTYPKNSMLLAHAASIREAEVNEFKTTFENFRFEVEVFSIGSNNAELYELCGNFFQRDFSDSGAVALVILNPQMEMSIGPSRRPNNKHIDESVILEYFKPESTPTLADKPKIYITEAGRKRIQTSLSAHFNASAVMTHSDVIGFHPTALDTKLARLNYQSKNQNPGEAFNGPLSLLCKNLTTMGESVNMTEIIAKTMADAKEKLSPYNPIYDKLEIPIEVVNTLTKELYFARNMSQTSNAS